MLLHLEWRLMVEGCFVRFARAQLGRGEVEQDQKMLNDRGKGQSDRCALKGHDSSLCLFFLDSADTPFFFALKLVV